MSSGRLQDWCEVLTLTWMHSLWQGAVMGIAVALLLGLLYRASATVRYAVALLGLGVFAVTVLITGITLAERLDTEPIIQVPARTSEVSQEAPRMVPDVPEVLRDREEAPESVTNVVEPVVSPTIVNSSEPNVVSPGLWKSVRSLALAWAPWIVSLWIGGVSLLALRFAAGWVGLRRLRRDGFRPVTTAIQGQLDDLRSKLGVRVAVRVLESTRTLTPIIIGWTKPLILLPVGMASGLSSQQLEAILLHELAHIRRHDFLANVVQRMIETVLFYHPAVWYLSSRIRLAREQCCDDLAVEASGDRLGYASVLALIEEYRQSTDLALAMGQKPLVMRIHRLLEPKTNRPLPKAVFIGILVSGLAAMIAWWPSSMTAEETLADGDVVPDLNGAEVSLYAVVDHAKDQNFWRIDFRQGKEIGREVLLKLRGSTLYEGFQLHRDRYAISSQAAVIDLEKRQVLRRPEGSLVGVIDDQVYHNSSDPMMASQLVAFNLNTMIEQPIQSRLRGGLLSPDGDWWLDQMHYTVKAPKLIRLADELTVNCPVVPVYYANPLSSLFRGAAMLWLDNETVLMGATNTDWITMNVFGEVEEIVTIPELDSARWWKSNPRLGPHRLFRDPLGTVVYEAERAFAIDVESKQWRPYDWHQLGHEFWAKPENCHWERAEFRYGEESIGWHPAWQRLAISDHLAVGGFTGISYWSTHTRTWIDLGMKSANVIGWVDHRAPSLPDTQAEASGESRGQPLVVRDWGTYVLGGDEEERQHSIHVYGGEEGMRLDVKLGDGS